MKNARIIFLLLALPFSLARAETPETYSVLGLALVDEHQYPSSKMSNIRGLSLSLFGEERQSVQGVAVGLGPSWINRDMSGIQFMLLGSAAEKFNGIQFSGVYSANTTFDGVTFAGLFNLTGHGGISRGLQIAGLLNIDGFSFSGYPDSTLVGGQIALLWNSTPNLKGVQIALGFNLAGECAGLQIALFNYATTLRGVQIGAVNIADKGSGLQIGLLNSFGTDDGRLIFPLVNMRF